MLDNTSPREPAKVVLDILQSELGLDNAHCLMGEQKWDIPPDQKLFLVAYDAGGPIISTQTILDISVLPPVELQQMVMMHDIRIEIMSYLSPEARARKEEIGLALESFFSRDKQELESCQVSRIQRPVDATASEETGTLWKYVAHVNVTALHTKTKSGAPYLYYSKFNVEPGPAHDAPDGTVYPPAEVSN